VLNSPSWIGINVKVNGEQLDLFTCKKVENFQRELNMKEGWYQRSFVATMPNGIEVEVKATRFLSLVKDELGVINYEIIPLNANVEVEFSPYLDSGITNEDTNWEDQFWETLEVHEEKNRGFIISKTLKTEFDVCTFMHTELLLNNEKQNVDFSTEKEAQKVTFNYKFSVNKGEKLTLKKLGGYVKGMNHPDENLIEATQNLLNEVEVFSVEELLQQQANAWADVWKMSDITINGDVKAQQGIRFNIFQLNQTYSGKDARLNIGPKGFTGEKYGGSTYWDTEAYCLPFYMATKDQEIAKNLLAYRYDQLDKAIENAEKLGFTNGAALYPMVTMNGEESHNEWEITFEEIHRNGAIAYAIYNYHRFTGDYSYIPEKGLEVLVAIARFWQQRATFSTQKNKYVILGVTGPNEYENNVNNNWYTNYIAKWCIDYALENIEKVKAEFSSDYERISAKTNITSEELEKWQAVADQMYFPYSEEHGVFLQQDGFLDKEQTTVADLPKELRPINQHWSWDRILRSPFIKQADTLQGFYFFEEHFSKEELEKHFDFYEPFTVHESSLSPCVHSIQAAVLGRMEQAYEFYLRTSRLDLDDYNKEVEEGCHITSMAGTWMSIVEGFAGMRVRDGKLSFSPQLPKEWKGYSFKINFRNKILKVDVSEEATNFSLDGEGAMTVLLNNKEVEVNMPAVRQVQQ
tara:strand:- start:353 stop:2422 length:2070 start_codon:yes stop_codon:yes gene_type:complete